jgi:hypothetical protein
MSHRRLASAAAGLLARRRAETSRAGGLAGWLGVAAPVAASAGGPGALAPWTRGYASRWPFPKSGGVEGFPDQFMNTIKKRRFPESVHEGAPRDASGEP